ncbi:MAG TPA: lipopolysaccharide heptosyltransferase II [Leptospiraceae bacterium]|nr:lipopolysaccharide heptosyltransferase II [Leptospiraceae bacterium]HMW05346.1 lipopolysaccharide heptosyltransferase II [Leptospiraceae bacterium]HMX34514.1 lipopolysaccharide heptosyltransferase II [Leptospiraceae bacterium]HMY31541.1 lipopolysaccharide heptosyltransferase II [Leptospiraceae bacterium]HMZ65906.1 lipopolysaccharide heptosyltransferase II [Leptospiraceae bacterium]
MKILIIQTAFLGDLILTTSFFREVKQKYKEAEIHVIVNKGTEDILFGNPNITKVISFDKAKVRKSIFYFFSFIQCLRKEKYEICICPHFSYRSTLISFFSGAKVRIGYKESGFSFLHTKKISRPLEGKHEVDKLFSLIHENTDSFSLKQKRPELFFSEARLIKIKTILETYHLNKNFIILAPSSIWETKRMPTSKFQELFQRIVADTDYSIVLIGSPKDQILCENIIDRRLPENQVNKVERIFNLAGKTDLVELSYVISQALAIVSNDSSPIHFASAHNIPTIMIYGATVPAFGYSTLVDKQYLSQVDGLSCRPCGIHGGKVCPEKHFKCMEEQNIDIMFKQLIQLIK